MPMVDVSTLKEWVENWFYMNRCYHPYSKSNDIPIPELYDILERMPTVDIVRCRDCQWSQYDEIYGQRWCDGRRVKPDHYCGYGNRKPDLSLPTDTSERCVFCGEPVPEGRQVCPICERR